MTTTATTPLRCPNCHKAENPAHPRTGPKATGAENERTRHGVRRNVYHIKCQSCKWQWWSSTKRARTLSQQVDQTIHRAPARRHPSKAGAP